MKKALFVAGWLSLVLFSGAAQATLINLSNIDTLNTNNLAGIYNITPTSNFDILIGGQTLRVDRDDGVNSVAYFALIAPSSQNVMTNFTLVDTNPEHVTVTYRLYHDNTTNPLTAQFNTSGNDFILKKSVVDGAGSVAAFRDLLEAGHQYVLSIEAKKAWFSDTNIRAEVTPPSNVPLPAAVWLFGSALMGLGVLSKRRKKV